MLVHPMADDGQQDFSTLMGTGGPWPDQISAVNNSCLAALLLVREAMAGSRIRWYRQVYECWQEALTALDTGSKDYLRLFVDLGKAFPNGHWCEQPKAAD